MARRKDHTRKELVHLAIQAGRELVIQKGTAALTARKVATAMGYTPGTLYNVFENIDALTAAINIESMHAFAEKLGNISRKRTRTKDHIRGIAQAYLDFHREEPRLWSLLFTVPIKHHSKAYNEAIHSIFDQVTEAMAPISGSPSLARQKAKILWSTLHGICLLQQNSKLKVRENDSPEELVAVFLDQFLIT